MLGIKGIVKAFIEKKGEYPFRIFLECSDFTCKYSDKGEAVMFEIRDESKLDIKSNQIDESKCNVCGGDLTLDFSTTVNQNGFQLKNH